MVGPGRPGGVHADPGDRGRHLPVRRALVVGVYLAMASAVVLFCIDPQLVVGVCALVVLALAGDALTYLM